MGICLVMIRLSDSTIDELIETPKKAPSFVFPEIAAESPPVGFLGRLFGKKSEIIQICSVPRESDDETDLDKAWEGMDYLLSDGRKLGGVARFLTEGGVEVPEEVGYGPPRVIKSAEVKDIDLFLMSVSPEILRARYEPKAMDRLKIYPQFWTRDGDEGFDYIISFFDSLRTFIREAAGKGAGIMIVYT